MTPEREMLRHMVATIAYRGGKAIRGAPEGFGSVSVGEGSRSAVEILAHIGDLFEWARGLADGEHRWAESTELEWATQVDRFYAGLSEVDTRIASDEPLGRDPHRLLQGPLADALTHIGQLALLRRVAEAPVRGENYFKAEVETGRVGPDQNPPVFEFD